MKIIIAKVLVMCMVVNLCVVEVTAAQKPKLSTKAISLTVGQIKTLKVKNTKKKARWCIKSGKKYMKLKAKKKTSVKIVGVKKGTAKVQCKLGKKKLICKVKVSAKRTPVSVNTPIPSVVPTWMPQSSTPTPTESPKVAETPIPKNISDAEVLSKLIEEQKERGAKVKEDLSSTSYTWDENGRLVGINWQDCELSGDISFLGLPTLKTLYLQENDVKGINLSQNTQLQTLDCGDNLLTSVDISDCNELEKLSVSNNQITQLDVSGNAKLKELYCRSNQLTELNVSNNVMLTDLDCGNNQLSELDVSANTKLSYLACYDNYLVTLDLRQNPLLYVLGCSRNQLTEVLLAPNDWLYRFYCAENRIEVLDVSMCEWLYELDASNNDMKTLIVRPEQELGAFQVGEVQVVLPTGEVLFDGPLG